MRTHRTHAIVAPWSTAPAAVVDAERLAAVRIEPVLRQRRQALVLDLYLADGDGATVVPLVLADPVTIAERDRDPLVFPAGTPGDDAFAAAVAERVLPHLERLVLSGERIAEHVLMLAASPAFEAARAAGCFGAAPLRESLVRLAPYRYARRFARGRSVRIDAPDAAGGWAVLRDLGPVAVASARRDAADLRWYGDAPVAGDRADVAIVSAGGDPGDAACIVRLDAGGPGDAPSELRSASTVVEVVDPLALDVTISFDPAEGPTRRWFAVERAVEPARRTVPALAFAAAGGSAGRIAVVLGRADGPSRPSADTDEARALVSALAAEGFDAVLAADAGELAGAALVHLFGTRDGRRAREIAAAARRTGAPLAVHAHDDDAAGGGWWGGEVARHCFEYGDDERAVESYLAMLARRAVAVGAASADVRYAPPEANAADADAVLRDAAVVFAATEEEAESIRARTGRRGTIVIAAPLIAGPSAVHDHADRAPIGALVGPDPFALVHAPLAPLANQLLVARCAADAGIPLVLAGPVADASYLERIREFGGPGLILLPGEPSPAVATALYASAAVVIDAAWAGEGGARLAAAALAGARLAISDRRRFTVPGIAARRFDPADTGALTRALGEAWDEALRGPARPDPETFAALAPGAVVRAIVRGYAAIESPVA
ncbi:MAG TPA: hypothetical protein VK669_04030 [Candidatus Limnocylindrales bacterium]|nr:hypothetical protein [Candidatus Limnocylindrales bacterium]